MAKRETHICGRCNQEFKTEEQYLDHECQETGYTPRDPEHLGDEFKAISEAALARGQEQKQAQSDADEAEDDE